MNARTERLVQEGLARRQGQRIILQGDLLNIMRRRELDEVAAQVSADTGLSYVKVAFGEHVAAMYRQRLTFAMIDNRPGFQLVPWSRELEEGFGQQVTGVVKDGGGIKWGIGRKCDFGL